MVKEAIMGRDRNKVTGARKAELVRIVGLDLFPRHGPCVCMEDEG